jgi:5-methylcytosine-specific restriction protein B
MSQGFIAIAKDTKLEAESPKQLNATLLKFFLELKKTGAEFGYRSASEILRFAAVINKLEAGWSQDEIADAIIMQKLLPKVHGSRRKLEPVLKALGSLCLSDSNYIETLIARIEMTDEDKQKIKYPLSFEKIQRMYQNIISNGFTSYAEA